MMQNNSPITVLSPGQAWDLLADQQLGRLAVNTDDGLDIFPVNYVVDGETLVFRTADGAKLTGLTARPQVCFETDHWDEKAGYSIVVKGDATPVTSLPDIAKAERLQLRPWVPTVKTTFVRIIVTQVSGRRFIFGPDPIARYR